MVRRGSPSSNEVFGIATRQFTERYKYWGDNNRHSVVEAAPIRAVKGWFKIDKDKVRVDLFSFHWLVNLF